MLNRLPVFNTTKRKHIEIIGGKKSTERKRRKKNGHVDFYNLLLHHGVRSVLPLSILDSTNDEKKRRNIYYRKINRLYQSIRCVNVSDRINSQPFVLFCAFASLWFISAFLLLFFSFFQPGAQNQNSYILLRSWWFDGAVRAPKCDFFFLPLFYSDLSRVYTILFVAH